MSEYEYYEDEVCAVDILTGSVILRLPCPSLVFETPGHFEAWLNERADMLPRLRAAHRAVLDSIESSREANGIPEGERMDWVVELEEFSQSQTKFMRQTVGEIMSATGWSLPTTEMEVIAGTPITLGFGLTKDEAVSLRNRCYEVGLDVKIKAIRTSR